MFKEQGQEEGHVGIAEEKILGKSTRHSPKAAF